MNPVFLSASVPYPRSSGPVEPFYLKTCDRMAIREAVRALCMVVLPEARLVFGGHPYISPMVLQIAEGLGKEANVMIFQSKYFAGDAPAESLAFPNIVWTDAAEGNRAASLEFMRTRMLAAECSFGAGVFIGGMEGVEEEFRLFRRLHPDAPALPVASTGAAALRLLGEVSDSLKFDAREALKNDFAYRSVFRRLLPGVSAHPPG